MKKTLFIVAVATLFFSCQKEVEPSSNEVSNTFAFQATIEQPVSDTKANINASNGLVWQDGDKIGIYVNGWAENCHQQFDLSSGASTTSGTFVRNQDAGWFNTDQAKWAFFPWQGTGSDKNNIYENIMYFKLPSEYWSYDDGDMLTPLVAPVVYSGTEWVYNPIEFKHAGAAVKLTVNNLASGTYKVMMTVTDKQITGDFHVNPANAGSEALALDAAENTSLNHVTLNTWKGSGVFNWIFPVPTLTKPKLQFDIIDNNGVTVWSKKLKAQANDLNRGDILVMPAVSITPYAQFNANATWSVCGDPNSWGDTKMITDGKLCIAKGVTFAANQQFKVRTSGSWASSYGWDQLNTSKSHEAAVAGTENNNIKISTAGTYDIIFNSSASSYSGYGPYEIRVVSSSFPYPVPKVSASITIDGTFTDWDEVTPEANGNTTVKIASDKDNIYVYIQRTNASGDYAAMWGGGGYVYIMFDYDNDWSTNGAGVIYTTNIGDFVGLLYPYAGTSAEPAFNTTATGSWQASPSPSTVANVTLAGVESSGTATFECCIPRADIPTVPTSTIGIKISGNKGMSGATFSREL